MNDNTWATIQVASPRSTRNRRTVRLAELVHIVNELASLEGMLEVRLEILVIWRAATADSFNNAPQSIVSSEQPSNRPCHGRTMEHVQ